MSEDTESFIEKVKINPVLFDLKHPDYIKNIRKKDKIWEDIGQELGMNGDQAKRKWKNLRDTYSKYLRSTKTTTGQAAKKNYGQWQWAIQIEFLKPFLAFAETVTNIIESSMNSENEDSFQNSSMEDFSASLSTQPQREAQTGSSVEPTVEPQRGQKFNKFKNDGEAEDSSVKDVINYLQKKREKPGMDEIEYLFMGHAKTVQKLSPRRQAITKMKVAQIISEQELLHLDDLDRANSQFLYTSTSTHNILSDDHQSIVTNPTPIHLSSNSTTASSSPSAMAALVGEYLSNYSRHNEMTSENPGQTTTSRYFCNFSVD